MKNKGVLIQDRRAKRKEGRSLDQNAERLSLFPREEVWTWNGQSRDIVSDRDVDFSMRPTL